MDVLNSLRSATELLRKEPKAFVPRIVTTLLYTFYTLYSIGLAADFYANQTNQAYLQENSLKIVFLLLSALLIYLIDVVSYAMYPRIVEDHHKGRGISLRKALSSAAAAWRTVILVAALIYLVLLLVMLPTAFFQLLYLDSGNSAYILLSALVSVAILIVFAILAFFVIPISVIEGRGALESLKESVRLGIQHKSELLKVNVFYAILALATTILVAFAQLTNHLSYLAITLFIIVRLVQAVVYTYISVTNPYVYLHLKEVNKTLPNN